MGITRGSISARLCLLLLFAAGPLTACTATPAGQSPTGVTIVAAENFWGSIASQLAGHSASVSSIVTNPNTDPHSYESNTADARTFADASYVILNGAGYDDWGKKLLAANTSSARKVLVVADLLGKKAGDNPHFWYNPDFVDRVADRITADLKSIDPGDTGVFAQQRAALDRALKPYHDRVAAIRAQYAGQKVGATENLFNYLADALGLPVISPTGFMRAVAEGNDPPAGTVADFQRQLTERQVKVLIYNTQTVTAVTTNIRQLAVRSGIPVVGMSETLQPVGATFEDWQDRQLVALQAALAGTH